MGETTRKGADLLLTVAAFAILVASVSFLWRNNWLLLAITLFECAVALVLWHDRLDLSFFFVIGVLGSLAEVVFVRFGVWHYANPTVLGMPIWFPFAFGTTGLIGARLARAITDMWNRARPEL